jgi:hypothetical protein
MKHRDWAFTLALAVAVVASITPLVVVRYLPFTDLPEHVAAMATIARGGDGGDAATYEIALRESPYLVYHLAGALLTRLGLDAVEANRVLLVATALAYPASLALALRALDRDPRLAIFACMPFLGRALFVGLLPYVASVPLVLVGIAIVARRARQRRRWHTLALALVAALLFYSHFSALLVFLATAMLLDLVLSLQHIEGSGSVGAWAKERLVAAWWLAPVVVIALVWSRSGSITMQSESLGDPGEIGRTSTWKALSTLPLWAFDLFRSHVDEACAVGFWLVLIVVALRGRAAPSDEAKRPSERWPFVLRVLARMDASYVPFFCALAVYVAMPFRVGGGTMLNVRLAPIVILVSVLAIRPPRGRWLTMAAGAGALITAVHAANAVHHVRALSARYMTGFDDVLANVPPGSKVVTLSFDRRGQHETHFQPYPHVAAYSRVPRGGGIASFSFTEMRHWSVHYRSKAHPPKKDVPLWIYAPCKYENKIDGRFYDFVFVIGDVDPFASAPVGPRFAPVARTGKIVLYGKTGEEISPEAAASDAPCASTTLPCCGGSGSSGRERAPSTP